MKNMIASQKKGNVEMGLNYHNLMEDIVLQHVDRILEADGCCCCDICKSDVIAYALNHLPPQYVVTDTGRMMVKLKNCDSQNRTDVLAALSNAVKLIRDNRVIDTAGPAILVGPADCLKVAGVTFRAASNVIRRLWAPDLRRSAFLTN